MINDSTFPQLKTILDADTMGTIFQQLLLKDEPTQKVILCQIERAKYKPGNSCLISYTLTIRNERSLDEAEHRLSAKFFPPGESEAHFAKTQRQNWIATGFAAPVLHMPELSMVVWQFPNDRKLTFLPKLIDNYFLQRYVLPPMLAAHFGNDWRIVDLTQQVVHYAPELTCTVRLHVRMQSAVAGQEQSCVLFGKTFYNDAGGETDWMMHELWHSVARQSGVLGMAQPLGYQPDLRFQWQVGLQGKTLLDYEHDSMAFSKHIAQAARVVAALHQSTTSCTRTSTVADWLTQLCEIQRMIASLRPQSRPAVDRLVEHLLRQADALSLQPVALLHSDLHLQNFFVLAHEGAHEGADEGVDAQVGGHVALIDLDGLALGSPWQDVGSFLATLYYRGIINGTPHPQTEAIVEVFCQAYASASAWPFVRQAVDWYTAAALLNQRVYRAIARLKNNGLEPIDALLDCAIRITGLTS